MRKSIVFIALLIFHVSLYAQPLKVPDYDPFKQTEKILNKKVKISTAVKPKREYILYAIYDQKVNINGKFYTLGEKVGRCNLWKIMQEQVLLKCHNKIKRVGFLSKKTYKRVEVKQ